VVGNFTALHEQEIHRLVLSLDILKNLEGDPDRIPPDLRQRETLFYDDYLKRKWQKFQLMIMAVTLLGCAMRFVWEEYEYRKQLKLEKKIKVDMKLLEQDENLSDDIDLDGNQGEMLMEDPDKMTKINDILKKSGDMFAQDNMMNHETIDPYSQQQKNGSGQFNNMLAANHQSNIFDEYNTAGTPEGGGGKPSAKILGINESMEQLNENAEVEEEVVQFRNDTVEDEDGPAGAESPGKKAKGKGKKGKKGKGKGKTAKNPPVELNETAGEEAFEAAPRDVSPSKKGAKGKKGKKKKDDVDDAKAYLTDMKETGQNF
jgi:hypothetical protein